MEEQGTARKPRQFWIPIGKQLRQSREQLGLTQGQVANKLGVSDAMISNYEKGTSAVDAENWDKYAEILQTTVSDLFGRDVSRQAMSDEEREWQGRIGVKIAKLPAGRGKQRLMREAEDFIERRVNFLKKAMEDYDPLDSMPMEP